MYVPLLAALKFTFELPSHNSSCPNTRPRLALMLYLVEAMQGCWVIEQPHLSLLRFHPRLMDAFTMFEDPRLHRTVGWVTLSYRGNYCLCELMQRYEGYNHHGLTRCLLEGLAHESMHACLAACLLFQDPCVRNCCWIRVSNHPMQVAYPLRFHAEGVLLFGLEHTFYPEIYNLLSLSDGHN